MNVFSSEQPTGFRYCDRIKMFSVQTTLGTRPGLGYQTCYDIPSDQLLSLGERLFTRQMAQKSTEVQQNSR